MKKLGKNLSRNALGRIIRKRKNRLFMRKMSRRIDILKKISIEINSIMIQVASHFISRSHRMPSRSGIGCGMEKSRVIFRCSHTAMNRNGDQIFIWFLKKLLQRIHIFSVFFLFFHKKLTKSIFIFKIQVLLKIMKNQREYPPSRSFITPEICSEKNLVESFLEKAQADQMSTQQMMDFLKNNNDPKEAEISGKIIAIFEKMQENRDFIPNDNGLSGGELKKWGAVLLSFHLRRKIEKKIPLFSKKEKAPPLSDATDDGSFSEAEHKKMCQENEKILKTNLSHLVLQEWRNFIQTETDISMTLSSEYLNKKLNEQQGTQNQDFFLTMQDPQDLIQKILDSEKYNGFEGCLTEVDSNLNISFVNKKQLDSIQKFFRAQKKGEKINLKAFSSKQRQMITAALRKGFFENWKEEGEWAVY